MADRTVTLSKHEIVVDRDWLEEILIALRTNQEADWSENDPAAEFEALADLVETSIKLLVEATRDRLRPRNPGGN